MKNKSKKNVSCCKKKEPEFPDSLKAHKIRQIVTGIQVRLKLNVFLYIRAYKNGGFTALTHSKSVLPTAKRIDNASYCYLRTQRYMYTPSIERAE